MENKKDFRDKQALNNLTELQGFAKQFRQIAKDLPEAVKMWQAMQKTPGELVKSGALSDSTFDGLPADVLSNFLGSCEDFVNEWWKTHGVNVRLMTE